MPSTALFVPVAGDEADLPDLYFKQCHQSLDLAYVQRVAQAVTQKVEGKQGQG